jgi:predicted short-subunit dehydrogenase-like oxidoreductase (DUF2520 family)
MQGITIIGPGRVGGALALALAKEGHAIEMIVYRDRAPARRLAAKLYPRPKLATLHDVADIPSRIVFVTTQDDEISAAAEELAKKVLPGSFVFHTSGSLSVDVLSPVRAVGCKVASIHPLASISSPELGAERFRGAYFCLEGDEQALKIGRRLVKQLGGISFKIDRGTKPIYHAAAVMTSGHVTALFDIAVALMQKTGLSEKKAQSILHPLLAGTVANLAANDASNALTGPFARADVKTVERQIAALSTLKLGLELCIYLELAERSLTLAEKSGADRANIAAIRKAILMAKRDARC